MAPGPGQMEAEHRLDSPHVHRGRTERNEAEPVGIGEQSDRHAAPRYRNRGGIGTWPGLCPPVRHVERAVRVYGEPAGQSVSPRSISTEHGTVSDPDGRILI